MLINILYQALDEDEEVQTSDSNVDFNHQVPAADDGTGHPIVASGSDARSVSPPFYMFDFN